MFAFAGTIDVLKKSFSLILPDTSKMQTKQLAYNVSHQELLRESRNDTLLSRYTIREQHTKFNYAAGNLSLFASWSRNVYRMDDLFETDYTKLTSQPISHRIDLKAQTHIKNWLIQPGINYTFSRTQDTLFITDFPSSDVSAMNSYFFDLLPETIGDTIPYNNSLNAFNIEILASKNRQDQSLFFYLKYAKSIDRLTEIHKNTSTHDKLKGPRESLLKFNYSSIKAMAGWQVNTHSLFWAGINYHFSPLDWRHTVFPDEPDTLEIVQLADAKTNSFHAQLGYKALSLPLGFQTTLSAGHLTNITGTSTPVLGYVLRILPISHQAELVASSSYLLAHIHMDYPLKAGNSTFLPRLDVIAARFWTDISLEALLQFGLEDIDFQEHYIHAATIASIGCEAKIALNHDLFLIFEADQLIPYVKTISPEPPTPTPSDIKRYGGLSVSAGVTMSW
ncbi:MAG: hypothetical protein U9Q91_00190 [Candidatus Marinimicrobia bacterium]|nr:hypothetical protein [Candidatus Neomarinimicrobiota bacterium]